MSDESKWIKVRDQLPELETDVNTYDGITVRGQHFGTANGRYPKGRFLPTWYKPFEWLPQQETSNEQDKETK